MPLGLSGPSKTLEGSSSQPGLTLHPTVNWAELMGACFNAFPFAPGSWPRADEAEDNQI